MQARRDALKQLLAEQWDYSLKEPPEISTSGGGSWDARARVKFDDEILNGGALPLDVLHTRDQRRIDSQTERQVKRCPGRGRRSLLRHDASHGGCYFVGGMTLISKIVGQSFPVTKSRSALAS